MQSIEQKSESSSKTGENSGLNTEGTNTFQHSRIPTDAQSQLEFYPSDSEQGADEQQGEMWRKKSRRKKGLLSKIPILPGRKDKMRLPNQSQQYLLEPQIEEPESEQQRSGSSLRHPKKAFGQWRADRKSKKQEQRNANLHWTLSNTIVEEDVSNTIVEEDVLGAGSADLEIVDDLVGGPRRIVRKPFKENIIHDDFSI